MTDREWGEHVRGPLAQSIHQLIARAEPSEFRALYPSSIPASRRSRTPCMSSR